MYWGKCAVARLKLWCNAGVGSPRIMPVQQCPRNWGRLNHILRRVSRSEVGTAMLGLEFGLYVNPLLEKDALKQRILVPQHKTLVRRSTVGCIQVG